MINEDENIRRNIMSRLVILTTTLKTITIAFWVLNLGGLFTVAAAFFDRDYWWLGGIIGILLGYGFGTYFASVFNLLIEWMMKMSIAQGEIVVRMKSLP